MLASSRTRRIALALLAVASWGYAGAVHAEASASVTLLGLQYRVIDLTPDDGIAASASVSVYSPLTGSASATSLGQSDLDQIGSAPVPPSGTLNAQTSSAWSSARYRGNAPTSKFSATAAASASGPGAGASVNLLLLYDLFLGDNTAVEFVAFGTVDAAVDSLGEAARAGIELYTLGFAGGSFPVDDDKAIEWIYADGSTYTTGDPRQRFSATFSYSSRSGVFSGLMGLDLSASAEGIAGGSLGTSSPVPEPSQVAMLLAGLCMLGAGAGLRRKA